MWSIVCGHVLDIDVNTIACAVGHVVAASHLLDDFAVLDDTGTQEVIASLVEGHGAAAFDCRTVNGRFCTIGCINNGSVTVRCYDFCRHAAFVASCYLVNSQIRIFYHWHIGVGDIIGLTILNGVEHIAVDALDVRSLAAGPVDNQRYRLFLLVHLNVPPVDATHLNLLVSQIAAPSAERFMLVAIVIIIVCVEIRSVVVLHIEVDLVTLGGSLDILAGNDRRMRYSSINEYAHLEGGVFVKGEGSALGDGVVASLRILAVGSINQCAAFARRIDVYINRTSECATFPVDNGVAVDKVFLCVALNLVIEFAGYTVASYFVVVLIRIALPYGGETFGNTFAHSIAKLEANLSFSTSNNPLDTVVARECCCRALTLVGDASCAAGLDESAQSLMPLWMHEVRIEHTWSARHCKNEGISLYNVPLNTMLIVLSIAPVVVTTVGRQILESVMVVKEGNGIAFEYWVIDKANIVKKAVVAIVECFAHVCLQWEVESSTLVSTFHVGLVNPVRDVLYRTPILAHAEGWAQGGIILCIMLLFEAHSIVVAVTYIA